MQNLVPKRDREPCRFPTQTHLNEAEDRFLCLEVALGRFTSKSDAVRHYVRKGLEAEGVRDEVALCRC
jgi:Arc/MetJ-type ribon-helix-helix transcriptional regulator